jgi:hypothetical protein
LGPVCRMSLGESANRSAPNGEVFLKLARLIGIVVAVTVPWAVLAAFLASVFLVRPDESGPARALVNRTLPLGSSVTKTLNVLRGPSFAEFARQRGYDDYRACTRDDVLAGCDYGSVGDAYRPNCPQCRVVMAEFSNTTVTRTLNIYFIFDAAGKLSSFAVDPFDESL